MKRRVRLANCPIGLFMSGDELCVKTEYANNEGRIDAFIVSTGEFYWGAPPQTIASQRAQLVTPVDLEDLIGGRLRRQKGTYDLIVDLFGEDPLAQRAVRFLEEAIEAYQAATAPTADASRAMAHKLLDFVFDRNPGSLHQELGGVGVTLLALAECAGIDADAEEVREIARVRSKPKGHFRARNKAKNDAGFKA